MISFYSLPSTIVGNPIHKTLNAAYSYYNVSTKTPMKDLMQGALILAKQASPRREDPRPPHAPA